MDKRAVHRTTSQPVNIGKGIAEICGCQHHPAVEQPGQPLYMPLFRYPNAFIRKGLEMLPQAVDAVMPLSRQHKAALPDAVQKLSALLTFERGGKGSSYWSAPRFISAYLRYFLPWNMVRLCGLLPGLDLPDPTVSTGAEANPPYVVDVGSGPLTLPLALWLSRPDWRSVPLELVCVDTAPTSMELGRCILEQMASLCGEELRWKIRLIRSPMLHALRELRRRPLLIMAGNVLNELKAGAGVREEILPELVTLTNRALDSAGAALFVEPGTRHGGTLLSALREAAREEGMPSVAPCPHDLPCPMLARGARRWCHFVQQAWGPRWLLDAARKFGLSKTSLSLSFLLLRQHSSAARMTAFPKTDATLPVARIVSDSFPVPGMGYACYACSDQGLAIIPAAAAIPFGALVACRWPDQPHRDAKSGALELHWRERIQKQ